MATVYPCMQSIVNVMYSTIPGRHENYCRIPILMQNSNRNMPKMSPWSSDGCDEREKPSRNASYTRHLGAFSHCSRAKHDLAFISFVAEDTTAPATSTTSIGARRNCRVFWWSHSLTKYHHSIPFIHSHESMKASVCPFHRFTLFNARTYFRLLRWQMGLAQRPALKVLYIL